MLVFSKASFTKAREFILTNATEPEKAMFRYFFEQGSKEDVIKALSVYQNEDGGFGGLEYDFELDESSGMATLKAFQYFKHLQLDSNYEMIQRGIKYFIDISDEKRLCFQSVPPEVNNVPRAFWWNYGPPKKFEHEPTWGELVEDYNPNTNAEIVSYLISYQDLIPADFPLESFKKIAIDKISTIEDELDMHAFFCYTKLWDVVSPEDKEILARKLKPLIKSSIEPNPVNWKKYTPQPLMFVDSPISLGADLIKDEIELNLDYLISTQGVDGSWSPNWSWGGGENEEAWQRAKIKWQGYITLNNLLKLSAFGRI